MVGRDTPEPNARGDIVRPRGVQTVACEPRIPKFISGECQQYWLQLLSSCGKMWSLKVAPHFCCQ